MNEAEGEASGQLQTPRPSWISAIEDRQGRSQAERLYAEYDELLRRHERNLKFVTSLRAKDTVQEERIARLSRRRAVVFAAIFGGVSVIGLAALLIANYPTLAAPSVVFLSVLLGRACFPAVLDLLKGWARSHSSDRL